MFDPNAIPEQCEKYLCRSLGQAVKFLRAEALPQSTRAAPWRVDVRIAETERSYVLQVDPRGLEEEYRILKAVESIPVPTPHAYGLDLHGEALGLPCFFSDFIHGESLLGPMLRGEAWAEALFFDSLCALHSTTDADLGPFAGELERISPADQIEKRHKALGAYSLPLEEAVYQKLKAGMPPLPPLRFSNGDLWLDNFITRERKLAGVIDFTEAAFSDPLFEFLLSFFVEPKLQGRGIEARYCQRIGVDPGVLDWYHGLEYYDVWHWLLKTGKNFVHHSAASVEENLKKWLENDPVDRGGSAA